MFHVRYCGVVLSVCLCGRMCSWSHCVNPSMDWLNVLRWMIFWMPMLHEKCRDRDAGRRKLEDGRCASRWFSTSPFHPVRPISMLSIWASSWTGDGHTIWASGRPISHCVISTPLNEMWFDKDIRHLPVIDAIGMNTKLKPVFPVDSCQSALSTERIIVFSMQHILDEIEKRGIQLTEAYH